MIAAGLAHRTIADRIRTLTRFETETATTVIAADVTVITDWIAARPDVSASTRAAYHSMLCAFYRWANRTGLRADNPMDQLPAARRPRRCPRPVSDPRSSPTPPGCRAATGSPPSAATTSAGAPSPSVSGCT